MYEVYEVGNCLLGSTLTYQSPAKANEQEISTYVLFNQAANGIYTTQCLVVIKNPQPKRAKRLLSAHARQAGELATDLTPAYLDGSYQPGNAVCLGKGTVVKS